MFAVIINHVNQDILPSGYLGVDVFFVISGYVITASLAGRKSKNFADFITGFYARRVRRLVPALAIFVLTSSLLISLFNPEPGAMLGIAWRAMFGISNLQFFRQSTDYFAQSTELNPFTHTWSLGVEEQFYLLFPLLFWFSGFGRQAPQGARNLGWWAGALAILSLLSFISLYPGNQPAAYFLMPPRFWEMAAGCLIFIGRQRQTRLAKALEKTSPLAVTVAMIGVVFLPLSWAVPATIASVGLSVLLIACLKPGDAVYRLFTHRRVVYIGLISYSLYLWHWGVLCISRWTVGLHWWSLPIQFALMLALAMLSYHYIERPARHGFFPGNRPLTLLLGLGAATGSLTLSQLLNAHSRDLFQIANPQLRWMDQHFANGNRLRGWVQVDSLSKAKGSEASDRPARELRECHVTGRVSANDLHTCLAAGTPASNGKGRIFIVGDSHALSYSHGIRHAFPDRDIRTYTAAWGCAYLPEEAAIENGKRLNFNCRDYVKNIDALVGRYLAPGDMMVLGMDWGKGGSKNGVRDLPDVITSLATRVTSKGASFVLLDDVPELPDPLVCGRTWYRPFPPLTCNKTIRQVEAEQASLDAIGRRIQALPGAATAYVSLRSGLCEKGRSCSVNLDGVQIYRDRGHITKDAAIRYTSEVFRRRLSPLLD